MILNTTDTKGIGAAVYFCTTRTYGCLTIIGAACMLSSGFLIYQIATNPLIAVAVAIAAILLFGGVSYAFLQVMGNRGRKAKRDIGSYGGGYQGGSYRGGSSYSSGARSGSSGYSRPSGYTRPKK